MRVDNSFPGLEQRENGSYVLYGDLVSEETVVINLDNRLIVYGKIEIIGSLYSHTTIIAKKGIKVGGCIYARQSVKSETGIRAADKIYATRSIKARREIIAGNGIVAGGQIVAGKWIVSGAGINAGFHIYAGFFIKCGTRIFAGTSISGRSCSNTIRCAELREGEVAYGKLVIKPWSPYADYDNGGAE